MVDTFRFAIIVTAAVFAGQSVWFFMRTSFTSGKLMLLGMFCVSSGSVVASLASLGTSSPGWVYLIGVPFGYTLGIVSLVMWRRERGIMAHDPHDVPHWSKMFVKNGMEHGDPSSTGSEK